MPDYAIQPQDWVRTSPVVQDDETKLFGVKCIGTYTAGHVTVSASAVAAGTAMLFEQGTSTAAASVGQGANPGTDGELGVVDRDYHGMVRAINAANDWEAWLESALPGDAMHTLSTTHFVAAADQDCKVAGGYYVLLNNSLSHYMSANLSLNGPSSEPHGHDAQVLHELLQVKATLASVAGMAGTVKVYECDDVAGSSAEILEVLPAPGTKNVERAYPTDAGIGEPIAAVNTRRLVVKMAATTLTDGSEQKVAIVGRSYIHGPGLRKSKLWQKQ